MSVQNLPKKETLLIVDSDKTVIDSIKNSNYQTLLISSHKIKNSRAPSLSFFVLADQETRSKHKKQITERRQSLQTLPEYQDYKTNLRKEMLELAKTTELVAYCQTLKNENLDSDTHKDDPVMQLAAAALFEIQQQDNQQRIDDNLWIKGFKKLSMVETDSIFNILLYEDMQTECLLDKVNLVQLNEKNVTKLSQGTQKNASLLDKASPATQLKVHRRILSKTSITPKQALDIMYEDFRREDFLTEKEKSRPDNKYTIGFGSDPNNTKLVPGTLGSVFPAIQMFVNGTNMDPKSTLSEVENTFQNANFSLRRNPQNRIRYENYKNVRRSIIIKRFLRAIHETIFNTDWKTYKSNEGTLIILQGGVEAIFNDGSKKIVPKHCNDLLDIIDRAFKYEITFEDAFDECNRIFIEQSNYKENTRADLTHQFYEEGINLLNECRDQVHGLESLEQKSAEQTTAAEGNNPLAIPH